MKRRGFLRAAGFAGLAGPAAVFGVAGISGLAGCGGLGGAALPVVRRRQKDGEVELVLQAVEVWGGEEAGAPEQFEVGGKKMWFRPGAGGVLEQAWIRAGLFWNSRHNKIYLTAVILGPPVTINKLELRIGQGYITSAPARKFIFKPDKRLADGETVSSQAFEVSASILRAFPAAEAASITLSTSRGRLSGDLLAVPGDSPEDLRGSARFLFADFITRQQAEVEALEAAAAAAKAAA